MRCPARDNQVRLRVEGIAPEARCPKWLFVESCAKVVMEPTGHNENSRRAPSERHDGSSLMRRAMDPAYENSAVEYERFCLPLDSVQLFWTVIDTKAGRFDMD